MQGLATSPVRITKWRLTGSFYGPFRSRPENRVSGDAHQQFSFSTLKKKSSSVQGKKNISLISSTRKTNSDTKEKPIPFPLS